MRTETGPTRLLGGLALLVALFGTGCGSMLQAAYGFSKTEQRGGARSRPVKLEGIPPGATVERSGASGTHRLADPTQDTLSYAVTETVEVPRSRVPMIIGGALDLVGMGASIYLAGRGTKPAGLAYYSAIYFGAAAVGDGIFAGVYVADTETKVTAFEPLTTAPVKYTVRLGDEVRVATFDPAWGERVVFDFGTPADAASPGGPRLAAPLGPPKGPEQEAQSELTASAPPPAVPEQWFGWQIIPVDLLALTGGVLALTKKSSALGWASLGTYVAAPAIVHYVNGQWESGNWSFAARTLGPLAGGVAGFVVGLFAMPFIQCDGDLGLCALRGPVYGTLAGGVIAAVAASVIDVAVLAHKPDPEAKVEASALSVAPAPGVTDDGHLTFGLAGRF